MTSNSTVAERPSAPASVAQAGNSYLSHAQIVIVLFGVRSAT